MEGGNKLRLIVLFMSFHAMFTVLLLVGMAHMLTRMTHQEHENANLREILFKHVHMASKHKAENSAIETERRGFQNEILVKVRNETGEKVENDDEEVDVQPMILRIKRTTSPKCCEKGSRGRKGQKGDRGKRGRNGEKGNTGDDGQDGMTGQKGRRGTKGNKGKKGEMGVVGANGRNGIPGLHGQQGLQGYKGDKGITGDIGVTGVNGQAGIPGRQGLQGSKGAKGEKGESVKRAMFTESAHIVGQHDMIKQDNNSIKTGPETAQLMTSWIKRHEVGQMSYSNGFLRVGVTGYYYIYSQIEYRDGRVSLTGFLLCIDNNVVIEASNSVINSDKRYNTNYIGGVFRIYAGQRISVRTYYRQIFYFSEKRSYFGAFMIHELPEFD